jgi:hypothetical protein
MQPDAGAIDRPPVEDRSATPDAPDAATTDVLLFPLMTTSDNPRVAFGEPVGPAGLRPRWPRTNAHVGSRRPLLRWVRPNDLPGPVEVTLCRDRALTVDCVRFEATGEEGRPATDLTPGRWYWRPSAGDRVGATWAVRVPTVTRHDLAWGGDYDADGDGRADVIAQVGSQVWWWPSGESGLRGEGRLIAAGVGAPQPLEAGDIDGDGYADVLMFFPASSPTMSGLVAVGRGSPVGPRVVAGALPIRRVPEWTEPSVFFALGDIDGDRIDDVGSGGSASPGSVFVAYLGTPEHALGARTTQWQRSNPNPDCSVSCTVISTSWCAPAMDRSGDGRTDLYTRDVFSQYSHAALTSYVFAHNDFFMVDPSLDTRFEGIWPASCDSIGDLNGDGTAESVPGNVRVEAHGDFDGDGWDDQLARGPAGLLWNPHPHVEASYDVHLGDGFGATGVESLRSPGDLDGDGRHDLVRDAAGGTRPAVFLSGGRDPLPASRRLRLDATVSRGSPDVVTLGDLDGDGASEIARRDAAGPVIIPSGRSPASRRLPSWLLRGAAGSVYLGAGDLDGDGARDVVEITSARAVVLHRLGLMASAAPPPWQTLTATQRLHPVGDVDGDGLADLAREEGGRITLLRGVRGATPVEGATVDPHAAGTIARVVATRDVDADGRGDLLVDCDADMVISLAGAGATVLLAATTAEAIVPAGDVDGDGWADLLVRSSGRVRFFRGQSGGPREALSSLRDLPNDGLLALGDVTGDGRADVGLLGAEHRYVAVVPGGAAGPAYDAMLRWPWGPSFVSSDDPSGVGDWNGDGVSDVMSSVRLDASDYDPDYISGERPRFANALEVSFLTPPTSSMPITLRTR